MALTATLLRGRRLERGGSLHIHGGVLATGRPRRPRRLPDGWIVAPGLVDLQVNGFAGHAVGGGAEALTAIARALPQAGVTAFCPTLVTSRDRDYRVLARHLAETPWPDEGARFAGLHLEGPFLSRERPGAHPAEHMRAPTPAAVERLWTLLRPRIVTLAPELPGAIDAIRALTTRGTLVACGHTDADAATGREALAAGARLLTHAFNAMRGLSHREPSLLVAFLHDLRARVGLIADGQHVDGAVCALLARLAGSRLVLVSDAVAAAGAAAGPYRLGTGDVRSDGIRAVRPDGTLAGSTRGLDAGPRTLAAAGLRPGAALAAAISAPRRLLGLPDRLSPGDPADLVVLDPGLVPRLTLVRGRVAFRDPALPFDAPAVGRDFTA